MTTDLQDKWIDCNGTRIRYHDTGAGGTQGLPILFGHSYLWDGRMWSAQIAHFKAQHRCITPHLFGHGPGDAPLPEDCHNVSDLARIYSDFMGALGIDRYVVVGLSVGGMWAAHLAKIAPEAVRGMALMDTYLGAEEKMPKPSILS